MTSNANLSNAEPVLTERKCVLIVEEEFLARVMLSECFRDVGYYVVEAANSDEAKTLIAVHTPHLIVSDQRMSSSADGADWFAEIRQSHPCLPMIITSADAGSAFAASDDQVRWVTEPYSCHALIEHVQNEIGAA